MSAQKKDLVRVLAWIMSIVVVAVVTATFTKVDRVQADQAQHNIDKEAHPFITGTLETIVRDVGRLDTKVSENKTTLSDMHDEQLRQGMMLEQIQRTVNGGS